MIARSFTAAAVAALLTLVYPAEASADDGVRLLGEQLLPTGLEYAGTTVGGLSGIDRDPKTGSFVLLTDDRSAINPSRFYTADIEVSEAGLGPIRLTGQHSLRRADGSTYPSAAEWAARPCTESRVVCDRLAPVDPEDIRIDPHGADVWWSQEGDRNPPRLLTDPSIRRAAPDGAALGELELPPNYHIDDNGKGPRANQGIEGFTFSAGGSRIASILEGPLAQDGPEATPEHGALVRLTVQDRHGRVRQQVAYPVEPMAGPGPGINSVSAILTSGSEDPERYLVLERGVSAAGVTIRIFEADLRGATDIANLDALTTGSGVQPTRKKLVADLGTLGLTRLGIVEGMTWGPKLRSGERTLILVADDNFGATPGADTPTQVIALAMR
ncbi:esterase-like activity of phytase family protein [Nocardia cyriacigeorgica]|nr:esterase-like activity of phytase family protein [Nocardia cyriacigeorgica]